MFLTRCINFNTNMGYIMNKLSDSMKISAVILTYNNESEIRDCLESITWADEILILDSNSADATVKICKEFTDRIFNEPFATFGQLRNKVLSLVSHEWVFSLDTDERVTSEARTELERIIEKGPQAQVYFIPRRNFIFGRWLSHGGFYPDYRQPQFFHKDALRYVSEDDVHEGFKITGKTGYFKNPILQYPFKNLNHYLSKMERYSSLMAKKMLKKGKRFHFYQLFTHPFYSFLKIYILKRGFLDRFPGLLLAMLYSYYTFLKYIKFWELAQTKKH